jgi:hypothetical protein
MNIQIKKNTVVVTRTNDKEKFYNESTFLYHIKNELIENGYDVIKKRMHKDGHLMGDESTQYIRDRKCKFAIYDGDYAIRLLHDDYNELGQVTLNYIEWGA